MANVLTGLYQTIYAAMNVVSREQIGMIPRVSKDATAEMASIDQPIRSPVVPAMAIQDINPSNISTTGTDQTINYVDLKITKQKKVSFHLTGEEEKGLAVGGNNMPIMQQRMEQAFRSLSNAIEKDLADLHGDIMAEGSSHRYGTAGVTPFQTGDDFTDATETMRVLDDAGAPEMGRSLVLNSAAAAQIRGKQPALFKVNEAGGSAPRVYGDLEMMFGFGFGISKQLSDHTQGTGTKQLSADASAGATSLAVDGTGIVNKGDIVRFGTDTNQYTVVEKVESSGTTLEITPALVADVNDNDTVVQVAYSPSIGFSMDAFHLACRVPAVNQLSGVSDGASDRMYVTDPVSGLTYEVAVYGQYRQVSFEVGICWGVKTIKPEHAVVLLG